MVYTEFPMFILVFFSLFFSPILVICFLIFFLFSFLNSLAAISRAREICLQSVLKKLLEAAIPIRLVYVDKIIKKQQGHQLWKPNQTFRIPAEAR